MPANISPLGIKFRFQIKDQNSAHHIGWTVQYYVALVFAHMCPKSKQQRVGFSPHLGACPHADSEMASQQLLVSIVFSSVLQKQLINTQKCGLMLSSHLPLYVGCFQFPLPRVYFWVSIEARRFDIWKYDIILNWLNCRCDQLFMVIQETLYFWFCLIG